jgi:predicted RNase H-like nuclease (RuvC/YqgF family)
MGVLLEYLERTARTISERLCEDLRSDTEVSEVSAEIEKQIRRLRELENQFDALLMKIESLREAVSPLIEICIRRLLIDL